MADFAQAFARRTRLRGGDELTAILAGSPPGVLSMTGGFPNPATFPTGELDEIAARLVREVAAATDEHGLCVDALAERLADGLRPKFVYTIPDYQNPTGRTLPLDRRRELVELCRRHGVLIFEDVAYRELAFDGASLPSLWSLAPDVVLQAGTFSKTFFPGVRLGWATGPADVVAELAVVKQNTDQCAGGLGQRMVEAYGRAGGFERHLPATRALYASHWAALSAALERHMPAGVDWTEPTGGFMTWLTLPEELHTLALRPVAIEAGV